MKQAEISQNYRIHFVVMVSMYILGVVYVGHCKYVLKLVELVNLYYEQIKWASTNSILTDDKTINTKCNITNNHIPTSCRNRNVSGTISQPCKKKGPKGRNHNKFKDTGRFISPWLELLSCNQSNFPGTVLQKVNLMKWCLCKNGKVTRWNTTQNFWISFNLWYT